MNGLSSADSAALWEIMEMFALSIGAFVIYFLPWITAAFRNTKNRSWVLILNVFFGLTIVGWIIAMAMASEGQKREATG